MSASPAQPAPTGTVTFLFTAINNSTAHEEQDHQQMQAVLRRYDEILRGAIEANGGYTYKVIGNAFQAAFSTAPQAVQAALDTQQALYSEEWDERSELRVSMALHTGVTEERGDDYFGPLLNRAARLLAAAHGGQVLLTQTTALLAQDNLPRDVTLKDLGEHRLRDLSRPEQVYQLTALGKGLPSDFPPLRTLETGPNNLPLQPTLFLGRDHEVAEVVNILGRENVFLLTLTGPGGIGKTRLALQAVADLIDGFTAGVFFVPLASISDPALVMPAIAHAIGIQEVSGQPILQTIGHYLRDKKMLLLLDNFEQVIDAGTKVAELLMEAPQLKVLVTSRASLRLSMEHEYPVLPLRVPDPKTMLSLPIETLAQYASVELFIQRAQTAKPDFEVDSQNAPAVAEICYRLEGIPLAIELAAARIKLLTPHTLLERLGSRLKLLTGGARDLHARQQTLRNTIEWSYDLLTEGEKQLFRRLSVFTGGYTLEAVEAVCGGVDEPALLPLEVDALDGITSLMDKSLMYALEGAGGEEESEPRYLMLETINEYAWDKLRECGETEAIRQRHANYFMALAEMAEPQLTGGQQDKWLSRLEYEHDNLRAALRWAREQREGAGGIDVDVGLRIGGAIWRFWIVRGYVNEGREQMAALLDLDAARAGRAEPTEAQPAPRLYRARVLAGAGLLAYLQGDYSTATALHEESLALYRELEDKGGISSALNNLGIVAYDQGDYSQARVQHEESLALKRELGEKRGIVNSLTNLGNVFEAQGDMAAARAVLEESLILAREMGDKWSISTTLINLGTVAQNQGDYPYARAIFEEGLAASQELGDRHGVATSLTNLGNVASDQEDYATARSLHEKGLALKEELGDKRGIAISLTNLGQIASALGDHASARPLFAQGLTLQAEIGDKWGMASSLSGLAVLAVAYMDEAVDKHQNGVIQGTRLFGAVNALLETMGARIEGTDGVRYERTVASSREQLGEETFNQAWEEGRAMSLTQAIEYALGNN